MTIDMKLKTVALRVRQGSASLRSTMPEPIVNTLKLSHGDVIDWELVATPTNGSASPTNDDKNSVTVTIRKGKPKTTSAPRQSQRHTVQQQVAPPKRSPWTGIE